MQAGRASLRVGILAAASLAVAMGQGPKVRAQEAEAGGALLQFRLGQALVGSSDADQVGLDGDFTTYSETDLGLVLQSTTRIQELRFSANGSLLYGGGLEEEGLDSPRLQFSYARTAANARLDAFARYQESQLSDREDVLGLDLDNDGIIDTETEITLSGGSRRILGYGAGIETGLESPLGFALDLERIENRYEDIEDPRLYDTEDTRISARVSLVVDPRITLRTTASRSEYQAENPAGTERTTSRVGVGGAFLVTPRDQLDVDIGWTQVDIDENGESRREEGASLNVGFAHEMRNGTLQGTLSSDIDEDGRRDTFRVTRRLQLPSSANLSFTLGAGSGSGLSLAPLYGASYAQDFRGYQISAQLDQRVLGDDEDGEVVETRLRANYRRDLTQRTDLQASLLVNDRNAREEGIEDRRRTSLGLSINGEINPVSFWTTGIDYTRTAFEEGTGEDLLGLDASYRRAMTRDIDLVASYDYTFREGGDEDSDQTLSLGIERTFSVRP